MGPRELAEGAQELARLPHWVAALLVVAVVCVLVALAIFGAPPGGGVALTH